MYRPLDQTDGMIHSLGPPGPQHPAVTGPGDARVTGPGDARRARA
ncbi:hypothetical protein RAJCM14343_0635 [Rhodococcus aetherivorans]|uniref:Uncharacterized protein n=1 Tax=Rhodococcus aetherivorans TaxID=191292 RepID=A0ABQ0YFT4_9NOCA|nr:hypothetical protein RAJCM14343_0635 [Rhodococcus aetherivorans]CCW12959.1 hypothetical protein EBESD8_35120 [Rhodococcus aetherivorans]